jgi:hypothetical protein
MIARDFLAIGVPTDFSEHIVQAGYHTVEALRKEDSKTVCNKLNGFRKEEELELQNNPIHFIWCASGYANLCNKKGRKPAKCTPYFEKLKACFEEKKNLHFCHKPYGFFNKYDRIENWSENLKCFESCDCSCRKKPV